MSIVLRTTVCLALCSIALTCLVDDDCALNGVCVGGSCVCSPGWTGLSCGQLDLLPAPVPSRNGYNVPNTSSWGAGVLFDESTQLYHMWAAEFINHCGLLTWHNNSRVIHATATVSSGPYSFVDEAVPVYSHNPSVARTADGVGVILMHIGAGEWNGEQAQCINGSSQSGNISSAASSAAAANSTAASYGTLCATALGAPLVSCNWTGAPGFTNPTLWVEGNGTIMTGGNSNYSLALSRGANCSNFACASWSVPAEVTPGRTGEDPWIWQDAVGHWHALFHDMSPDLPAGRHAFSRDGISWTLTSDLAYNGTITFEDGSAVTYSKRERPHLLLASGAPAVLFTGVMQFPEHVDDHSWTLAQPIRGPGAGRSE